MLTAIWLWGSGYHHFLESDLIPELADFCERDSGIDNSRIRDSMVGNRAQNVAGIRVSGDLLGTYGLK